MKQMGLNQTEADVLAALKASPQPLAFRALVKFMRSRYDRPGYAEASIRTAIGTLGREGMIGHTITDKGRRAAHEQTIREGEQGGGQP